MKLLIPILISVFVFSACSPVSTATEVMVEETLVQTTEPAVEETSEVMTEEPTKSPAWVSGELINVSTGEAFKLSDFSGKVILVENLAMWCPTCLKQQEQVKLLHEQLGADSDLISVGFDIDDNEVAEDLKKYVESNGFDWYYAIPSLEIVREIANLYGANFLNPPLTPVLIIDRKGVVHPMNKGLKSAEDLKLFIEPFLSEGM